MSAEHPLDEQTPPRAPRIVTARHRRGDSDPIDLDDARPVRIQAGKFLAIIAAVAIGVFAAARIYFEHRQGMRDIRWIKLCMKALADKQGVSLPLPLDQEEDRP